MVATVIDAKKKFDTARAWILNVAALIEPPSPTSPPAPASHAVLPDDDYEAAIIANIHVQAAGVQNIRCLILVTLDLSSVHYARWCDNVLLTIGHYSLSDHVLLDTTSVSVPA
jgi:hypothetical protein